MNILIFAPEQEQHSLAERIEAHGPMQYRKLCFLKPQGYDAYLEELKRYAPELIVIDQPGALGMEAVIAAKNVCPGSAVVWFSEDKAFGPQSYRLGCTYFAVRPVSEEHLALAIDRCEI